MYEMIAVEALLDNRPGGIVRVERGQWQRPGTRVDPLQHFMPRTCDCPGCGAPYPAAFHTIGALGPPVCEYCRRPV